MARMKDVQKLWSCIPTCWCSTLNNMSTSQLVWVSSFQKAIISGTCPQATGGVPISHATQRLPLLDDLLETENFLTRRLLGLRLVAGRGAEMGGIRGAARGPSRCISPSLQPVSRSHLQLHSLGVGSLHTPRIRIL